MCAMSSAVTEARRPVAPGHGATAAPSCCEGRIFGPLGTSGHWNNQIFGSSTFQFQNSQRGERIILFDTHKKIRVYKRNYDRKSNYDWRDRKEEREDLSPFNGVRLVRY